MLASRLLLHVAAAPARRMVIILSESIRLEACSRSLKYRKIFDEGVPTFRLRDCGWDVARRATNCAVFNPFPLFLPDPLRE
jgi:hypothetical protein